MNVRSKKELTRRRGFTIIELLIVIGVVMALSALILSGFSNLGANNRRQTCQSNMAQIYQSLRLYQQDEGAFPFYNSDSNSTNIAVYENGNPTGNYLNQNLGLWALYAFPKRNTDGSINVNAPGSSPIGRYVRSSRVLHCPQDREIGATDLLKSDGDININYLSYQRIDPDIIPVQPTYQSIRSVGAVTGSDWKRQLMSFTDYRTDRRVDRAPTEDTIVTWCRFHRPNGREFDNVLFYDGSVQLISKTKDGVEGWRRTPKPPI